MPLTVTVAVRDARALVERGEVPESLATKVEAALGEHDEERGATRIPNNRADSAQQQVDSILAVLNRHVRRFPNTDCSLALTMAAYFRGEIGNGVYLP